ncbi:MAG TPA: HIT domain-containing protein [Chthoniobacteraceae bacterium]|jgi:ATP adenylyltransferase|nr:HIT domain-containing protein [Chthoniobacteraceae bacterium]
MSTLSDGDAEFPDTLKALWAPWRAEYFTIDRSRDFLSEAAQASDDAAHLVVARRKNTFLILNRFPYAVGHMMAVPYRKVPDILDLTEPERLELWELAALAETLLRRAVNAQGFNVGLNIGSCAGAGFADHLHLHIVPRWSGDSNFMPVLADTRVMAEALPEMYAKLVALL